MSLRGIDLNNLQEIILGETVFQAIKITRTTLEMD